MSTTARISKSGQVTIPAKIRERLGLKPGDTVIWGTDGTGRATVRPVKYTLDDLDGILGPLPAGMSVEDLITEAVHEGVERRLQRSRGEG